MITLVCLNLRTYINERLHDMTRGAKHAGATELRLRYKHKHMDLNSLPFVSYPPTTIHTIMGLLFWFYTILPLILGQEVFFFFFFVEIFG